MTTALAAAGWSAVGSAELPSPEELVPNTVAIVSDVPIGLGTITKAEFHHALELTAVQKDSGPVPTPGSSRYERLAKIAVDQSLEAIWLWGEASAVGISVTSAQVSREMALLKRETFESEAEYHEFLKEAHFTWRDVRHRVELQLLSVRLQAWLQRRISRQTRSKAEEQKAFEQFIAEFVEKWRARTVCAPAHATRGCSNGPPAAGIDEL